METSEIESKRSVLLGYFSNPNTAKDESISKSLVLSSVTENVEKITDGVISKRIIGWRDLSRPDHEITIFSPIYEKNALRSLFLNVEEICLVDLGHLDAPEEDGIKLKYEYIRKNIRRACNALSQRCSVGTIEIDPCNHPKIAAESAVYGVFLRNEIECNVPKSSLYHDINSKLLPVCIRLFEEENISEPTQDTVDAFEEGLIIGECQNFARFLHGAGCYISRAEFVKHIQAKFLEFNNVKFIHRDEKWIQSMGMQSILQVASINKSCTEQGKFYACFHQPPCLLEIHYDARPKSQPIVMVGRSSFYHPSDSYFLAKTRQPVHLIQNLSGGASVIATILALVRLQIPVKVIGVIIVCDHSFCWRKASKMNIASEYDIFSEIPDSHEERLILKDAVSYSCTFDPELIITLATQTNYLTEAFQTYTSVMYSSDESVAELFLKVCSDTGERFIRLPFVDIEDNVFDKCVIKKQFCSDCSDVLNKPVPPETRYELIEYISKNWDFCFITSCCLKHLLKGRKWLHLEINKDLLFHKNEEDEIYEMHEITGSPTRSLIYFIQSLASIK